MKSFSSGIGNGFNYIQELDRLKAENEELKHKVKLMMDCPDCKVDEYKQCLDEIEEILNIYFDDDWKATREIEQLINQAKEGR